MVIGNREVARLAAEMRAVMVFCSGLVQGCVCVLEDLMLLSGVRNTSRERSRQCHHLRLAGAHFERLVEMTQPENWFYVKCSA
jgi:hypothetical protein